MNKTLISAFGVVAAVIVLGLLLAGGEGDKVSSKATDTQMVAVALHKDPSCGCCGVYGSYLSRLDYDVDVHNTTNLSAIKQDLGVPREVESCHTMEVGGYVVEGHIPEEVIGKLLRQQPDIAGIGMAGMPSGSPGMPGPKQGDFVVHEITHEGQQGDVFMTL